MDLGRNCGFCGYGEACFQPLAEDLLDPCPILR